jgi:hypothetical protein
MRTADQKRDGVCATVLKAEASRYDKVIENARQRCRNILIIGSTGSIEPWAAEKLWMRWQIDSRVEALRLLGGPLGPCDWLDAWYCEDGRAPRISVTRHTFTYKRK